MSRSKPREKGREKQQPRPEPKKPEMKFTIDSRVYVPKVQEPMVVCSICGGTIDTIANAISEPDGSYSHFDCVLKKIGDSYGLRPGQKVSYLGRGVFGIIETDEKGGFTIVERVSYESPEAFSAMKGFVERSRK